MKSFKQVLILCGGKATRLRPYSYSYSKAELPFLNLPLLAYPWKLAENLQNNSYLLNSHLFPEEFKKTVRELSKKDQKIQISFEREPLSSAGTLYTLKKELKKSLYFTYINGDCLLFPSSRQRLFEFEQDFLSSKVEALLFVIPTQNKSFVDSCFRRNDGSWRNDIKGSNRKKEQKRLLYCDSQQNLIEVRLPKSTDKQSYFFTGLALFKSSLLDKLKVADRDIFSDFLQPLLDRKKIKVFIDEEAFFLEAGDKESYLKSTEFCLKSLYADSSSISSFLHDASSFLRKQESYLNQESMIQEKTSFVKERLQEVFQRFDPKDEKVGLKNGSIWSKKLKALLLAPVSVRGFDLLKAEGFSVIAPQVRFYDKTKVQNSVLACPHSSLQGFLKEELILTKAH